MVQMQKEEPLTIFPFPSAVCSAAHYNILSAAAVVVMTPLLRAASGLCIICMARPTSPYHAWIFDFVV
jgi:hypothetical protein